MKFDENSIINRKKKAKTIKLLLLILLIIILYNIIIVGISSVNRNEEWNIFGYKAFIITSGSMSPKIDIGDVIIIKGVSQDEINTDDIITYKRDNEQTTTHRVINIIEENGQKQYITKGDNNKVGDEQQISFAQIEGKVILTIPYLGTLIEFLEDKMVILILILIILIILLIYISINERKEKRRRKRLIDSQKNKNNTK